MTTPLEDEGTTPHVRVMLVGFTLQVGYEETAVPLLRADGHVHRPPAPVKLREGAECRAVLTFRVAGDAVDGLKVVHEWWKGGTEVARREVLLGDFRVGGPYEVVLPAERLPSGPGARGLYEARARLIDDIHRILGEQAYTFEITRMLP
ncbi:RHO protein GDP dissociation inhibitor [Streptomyces sp. SLBN-118]|uniref:hypothetical protein n=1 Tax=Streptomyces sp. SLBN-118 TaxID=2768454 RepID=UPI001154E95A|nr:hypothetical protein [Streptomyces sp. SLBN-118]TQK49905.1 RHO protein GDP dissociation inhibitor [Streptomyces sp. SLBN-118]